MGVNKVVEMEVPDQERDFQISMDFHWMTQTLYNSYYVFNLYCAVALMESSFSQIWFIYRCEQTIQIKILNKLHSNAYNWCYSSKRKAALISKHMLFETKRNESYKSIPLLHNLQHFDERIDKFQWNFVREIWGSYFRSHLVVLISKLQSNTR